MLHTCWATKGTVFTKKNVRFPPCPQGFCKASLNRRMRQTAMNVFPDPVTDYCGLWFEIMDILILMMDRGYNLVISS